MEELREIAKAHYEVGSKEIQESAENFFKSMDVDGDKNVDLSEFLAFMKKKGYTQMQNPHFFKELDADVDGALDFWDVMTLYYIIKSGRPFCDNCGKFIPGIYFSCLDCFNCGSEKASSFNLCLDCYSSGGCKHNHGGQAQFLDNFTLFEAHKDSALGQAIGLKNSQARSHTSNVPTPSSSSGNVPNPSSTSTAIVPFVEHKNEVPWQMVAIKAVETVGRIAVKACTIL